MAAAGAAAAAPAEEVMPMKNWVTGREIGFWKKVGETEFEGGLLSDWCPYYRAADGTEVQVKHHSHTEGYFFLRLPCRKPNKPLFHRQLWQDLHGRKVNKNEVVVVRRCALQRLQRLQ